MQKKKTPLFGFDENNARCWLAANTSKDSKQYRLYIVTILYTQLNPSQLIEQIHYRRCKERWNYGSDESKSTGEGPCCSSSSHMTSNPLSASSPHPSPLLSPPRLLVLAHVSAYRFHGPPRKRHHLTGRSNSGENRVLRGTGLHYVTRVTACTSISISREIKIEKKENEKARISFLPLSLSLRSKGGFALSANRQSTRNDGYTHRPVVTQRNAWMMNFYI